MDNKTLIIIAIAVAAALGAVLGLLAEPPVPVVADLTDPAAYEIAPLLDEARRITAETAR